MGAEASRDPQGGRGARGASRALAILERGRDAWTRRELAGIVNRDPEGPTAGRRGGAAPIICALEGHAIVLRRVQILRLSAAARERRRARAAGLTRGTAGSAGSSTPTVGGIGCLLPLMDAVAPRPRGR